MTRAREQQISLSDTPYYHCINRCVRRAFLCGEDRFSGQNYDHRKQWILDQIKHLSSVFAIDVCAYAVMSNHYHVVLKVDVEKLASWSDDEVLHRWRRLFKGNFLVDRYLNNQVLSEVELDIVSQATALWRERLQDISWYMRCLNESIARQANREDEVKGRFWEGRFKSQALLDEQALLSCMMYVDLNPIRAGLAKMPETSEFTSIYERIQAMSPVVEHSPKSVRGKKNDREVEIQEANELSEAEGLCDEDTSVVFLQAFSDQVDRSNQDEAIPFAYRDYLELLDWTGRAIRCDKRGSIPEHLQPILTRLGIDSGEWWVEQIVHFRRRYASYVGSADHLQQVSQQLGQRWLKGQAA
jgi:REP element-mobilizing transposase RayT